MNHLIIAALLSVFLLLGPLVLFISVKLLTAYLGGLKVRFVKTDIAAAETPLSLLVTWDDESFEHAVSRIRVEFFEFIRGGRSDSFSVTFEDKAAKKRSFVLPLKLSPERIALLTDNGLDQQSRTVDRSYALVEVETVKGETVRYKIPKQQIQAAYKGLMDVAPKEIDKVNPVDVDSWLHQTRVFPWRKVVETPKEEAKKTDGHAPKTPSAPTLVDFIVTKVWIEPGCIVCDACENEAPQVFKVLADTCIVKDGADLSDAGSIKAAAEGCPVDVIKYDKAPKPAA